MLPVGVDTICCARPVVMRRSNNEEATLAHGVLVKGMAGGKREERIALLKAARQLGRATRRLGKAIGDEINAHIPAAGTSNDTELEKLKERLQSVVNCFVS
jgi:hypothetical protein